VTDSGGKTDVQDIAVTVADANEAPVITSNGGGSSASVSVAENQTAVTTVVATDEDVPAQTLTYSISGGADQALFAIDAASGVLTFISAPDYDNPTDSGANNVYDVQVTVTDSGGKTDVQDIAVTVSGFTARNDMAEVRNNPTQSNTVMIDVMANDDSDSDPGGTDRRRIVNLSAPEHGIAEIVRVSVPGGPDQFRIAYTPFEGFIGTDRFWYRLHDNGEGVATAYSTWAQVVVAVLPNIAPTGNPQEFTFSADQVVVGTFVAEDEYDDLQFSIVEDVPFTIHKTGSHTAEIRASSGVVSGEIYHFSVTVSDGEYSVEIPVTVNVVPVAKSQAFTGLQLNWIENINLLVGNCDPDELLDIEIVEAPAHGVLFEVSQGNFRWIPNGNWAGTDTFRYRVSRNGLQSEIARITINTGSIYLGSWKFGDSTSATPPSRAEDEPGAIGDLNQVEDPSAGHGRDSSLLILPNTDTALTVLIHDRLLKYLKGNATTWEMWFIDEYMPNYADRSAYEKNLLIHYLENSGTAVTIPVETMMMDVGIVRATYEDAMTEAMQFVNNFEFIGTVKFTEIAARLKNTAAPWNFGIGQYTTWGDILVTGSLNPDGTIKYEFSYTFNFWDPYDWTNKSFPTYEMERMHLLGIAQQFMMTGEMTKSVVWNNDSLVPAPPAPGNQ
jgi:hypothetical protein